MAKFLEWFTHYNSLIIQVLAGLIVLSCLFFIYKLFFSKHAEEEMSGGASSLSDSAIEKIEVKLKEILDKQEPKTISVSTANGDDALNLENSHLKTEIEKYKSELIIKDTEISQLKEQNQGGQSAPTSGASSEEVEKLNAQIKDFEQQIEKLNGRLAEYEIISDEIADLPKFKKENEDLKAQLATVGENSAPAAEAVDRQPEIDQLNSEIVDLKSEIESLKSKLADAEKSNSMSKTPDLNTSETISSSMHAPGEDISKPPAEDKSPSTLMVNQEEIDNLLNDVMSEMANEEQNADGSDDSSKKKVS